MKTEKKKQKKEKKQTSRDLVPKKDVKGGWGIGGTTPSGPGPTPPAPGG